MLSDVDFQGRVRRVGPIYCPQEVLLSAAVQLLLMVSYVYNLVGFLCHVSCELSLVEVEKHGLNDWGRRVSRIASLKR